MAETWLPINGGRQQSSYKEFTFTLPAGGVYTLNNPYNFCRCLESTGKFKVAWSSNQMDTDFNQGLQAKFDTVLPYVQFFNPSGAPIVISVGLGIGDFDDSRLSVSGVVYTEPAQYAAFAVQQYTFPASGVLTIPAAQRVIIQNTSSSNVYIGAANGLQLQQYGTFEYTLETAIDIYGTNGATVSVGSFN